jgi:glutathione S-transferase
MSEAKLVLHGSHVSTCTNAVKAFFRSTKIPYEFKSVNIFTGENKTEEYTKLNPFQKVPVLVEDNLVLRESMVLCRYLCNSRHVDDHWYPKDPRKRALVDLGLEFWSQNSGRFFAVAALKFGSKVHATQEAAIEAVNGAIKDLETHFLKDHKFVAGDQVSLADLPYLYYLQGQSIFTGHKYDEHKRLNQWFEDLYKADPALEEQVKEYQEFAKQAFAPKN